MQSPFACHAHMSPSDLVIVADENIPGLDSYAGLFGSIRKVAAAHIDRALLEHAEVLLVRSVTRVDESLLNDTSVTFVGSATAGIDHVDVNYLRSAGIIFAHAPASNAVSVVEYVLAAIAVLATRCGRDLRRMTAGVVGCGAVGGRLAARLEAIGMNVLRNDPPREEAEGGGFVSLEQILAEADLISMHTPLTRIDPHPTHHLIGSREINAMKPDAWLINAARGAVIDSAALAHALQTKAIGAAVLDVWEHEPDIDLKLLDLVDIGTPHIAGYSYDAKLAGTRQVMGSLLEFLAVPQANIMNDSYERLDLWPADPALPSSELLRFYIDQMYDITADDARMRLAMNAGPSTADAFRRMRKEYPRRYTFGRYGVAHPLLAPDSVRAVSDGLRIDVEDGLVAHRR